MDTTITTPVATPETSPAAPATSAPSPSVATSQRPASFEQALEQAAAAEDHAAATPETAATGQAAPPDPASATHPNAEDKGPIPFSAHKTALDNARVKEREAVLADVRQKVPFFDDVSAGRISPEAVGAFYRDMQQVARDPFAYLERMVGELSAHPEHGPQMRSWAARQLASYRGQGHAEDTEPQPDREIVDGAGNVIGVQFADGGKAWAAWQTRQELAKVRQEFAPLKAAHAQQQQVALEAQQRQQIETTADGQIAELLDILDLSADAAQKGDPLLEAVSTTMAQHPEWSAHKAALHVRKTHIAPSLESKAEARALDTLKKKAAGNTASGGGAAAPPARPRDAKELAQWMEAHAR